MENIQKKIQETLTNITSRYQEARIEVNIPLGIDSIELELYYYDNQDIQIYQDRFNIEDYHNEIELLKNSIKQTILQFTSTKGWKTKRKFFINLFGKRQYDYILATN